MAEKQVEVKLLRSIGTSRGVLNPGSTSVVEERVAKSWEAAGFAEILGSKQAQEPKQDAPEEDKESSEALEVPEADAPQEKKPATRKTGAKK